MAVLFVDLAGSTRLAETRPPGEVVGLLNAFFGVVVDAVTRHDGWINKFEGDAALAVFGAPVELPDAAACALSAARELGARLAADVPQVTAGIGVSAGSVVAGYIGAEQRFEYTVIGDPVNEAARLSDLAKASPGSVLASAAVLESAASSETSHWEIGRSVILRGRTRPTRLAIPHQPLDILQIPRQRVEPPPEPAAPPAGRRLPRLPRLWRRRLSILALLTTGHPKPDDP